MKTKIVIVEHDPADIELIQHELKKGNVNYISEMVQTENEYEKALHNFKTDIILKESTLSTKTPIIVEKRLDLSLNRNYSITKETPKKKRVEKAFKIERQRFEDLYLQAPSCMGILKGPNHVYELANDLYLQLIDKKKDIIGKTVKEVLPELEAQGIFDFLDTVYKTGKTFSANEMLVKFDFHGNGKLVDTYLNFIYQAHRDIEGHIDGIFFFANDVTEQVVSRKKIEESEKKHRFLFENNPMPIWIIDSDTFNFLDVNEMAVLKYGYSREEFLLMNAIDIRPEEDKERFRQSKNSFKSNETIYNSGIWNHLKKDGTIISVEIIGHKIIYEGSPALFILSNDITGRKKAEESLLQSESRLKEAQEIAHLGNWELNFETGIALWSDETCRIYGLSPKDNKQSYSSWISFIHPDDMDNVMTIVNESQRTLSNSVLKNRIILKDGTIKHIDSECRFEFDQNGKPISLFGVAYDVTEIKLARLQLEQQNKELAFQNEEKENRANELIIANTELSFQNSEKGDRANELIIANIELAFQNSDKEERANELIIANTELAFQNSEKEERANELIIANTELAFQNSEKEERANELIIANTELAFQNSEKEERANELIIANNDLIKTNTELDRFVYSVSHDLRSPLTSILGLITFIEEESQEADTLEHILMIRNSINRLDEFIKNILNYSRNNRTELEIEKILLQKTAVDIVDLLHSMEEAKGIHFEIDIKEQDPFYSDKLRLNIILENLISNAIKYHQKDESGRYIKITGQSDPEKLQFSIADNGIGIAPAYHTKIFDMFFRLSSNKDGSGIGLYIVKGTVGILQGTIQIHSEEGVGTTFSITLKNLKK